MRVSVDRAPRSAPSVVSLLPFRRAAVSCTACGTSATSSTGWKAMLCAVVDDEPPQILVYCPACAGRELASPT